jgi:hypothetical protein
MRVLVGIVLAACSQRAAAPVAPPMGDAASGGTSADASVAIVVDAAPAIDAPPPQLDPDGNDDPEDPGSGKAPATATWKKVGTPPLALKRICDLTPLGDALYLAHANSPLGSDGATITRYRPGDAKRPFTVAFDWNRYGQPTGGGGAGQGFVRVRAIDGKLYVADADPPYNGLGIVERGTEGYVFISGTDGVFAPPRMPGARPPATAGVLPRAYHVLDVVKFRGALYASAGSVPPRERAWRGPSPGALHRANDDATRWLYEVDYPFPYQDGVWRLTYMVRFRDRLYAGIQDYDGRDPHDYVVFEPEAKPGPITLTRDDLQAVRVTPTGAAGTLRWWVDTAAKPHRLYWIAWARDGVNLRVTTDGDTWKLIPIPKDAGRPTDITRFRDAIVVLTERGLWRLAGDTIAADPIAKIDDKKSPFEVGDFFCAAPLAVFDNALYAGGQGPGSLYVLDEAPLR